MPGYTELQVPRVRSPWKPPPCCAEPCPSGGSHLLLPGGVFMAGTVSERHCTPKTREKGGRSESGSCPGEEPPGQWLLHQQARDVLVLSPSSEPSVLLRSPGYGSDERLQYHPPHSPHNWRGCRWENQISRVSSVETPFTVLLWENGSTPLSLSFIGLR